MPHIFQINVSQGSKPKLPIHDDLVTITGLASDKQSNKEKHGGPERALCLFSLEKIIEIQKAGIAVFPGAMGENITFAELDLGKLKIGDKLQLGEKVVIEVSKVTGPCKNISKFYTENTDHNIDEETFRSWSRLYARVIIEGIVHIGDKVTKLI